MPTANDLFVDTSGSLKLASYESRRDRNGNCYSEEFCIVCRSCIVCRNCFDCIALNNILGWMVVVLWTEGTCARLAQTYPFVLYLLSVRTLFVLLHTMWMPLAQ
jgi:hypothetical protein